MNKDGMAYYMKHAEVVQIMHSNAALFNLAKKYCNGKIIIYHTGSMYRNNQLHLDNVFKGHRTATDQTEFMKFGNHKYIVSPVYYDCAKLYKDGKKRIGHYPSLASAKGTDKIMELLKPFADRFTLHSAVQLVPHEEQIKRMSNCDIYIELFQPTLNGKEYGCFGVTALEAAALGRVVVTQNLYPQVYEKEYGTCPLTFANNETEFSYVIDGLLKMNTQMFRNLQKETAQIMKENHSFEATGNKIANFIYESKS